MGEKIIVGPVGKGLKTIIKPFYIDNDAFPQLENAYTWRGQLKRKRGTKQLTRLSRFFNSQSVSYNPTSIVIALDGSGNGNLLTGYGLTTLAPNASIFPGSVSIVNPIGPITYTDPTQDGFLTPTGTGGPNTINYATGVILIPAQAGQTITAQFIYYPDLPVMGLEDLTLNINDTPRCLAFDTVYSYEIDTSFPNRPHDVSFYKNPAADAVNLPGYIPKTNWTPLKWNGQDYQQFWTVNYQGALWATNGINIPFSITNIGMQFKPIITVTIVSTGPPVPGPAAVATLQIIGHGLVVGDFIFINEVVTTLGINFQSGYVISVVDANNVNVEFPFATLMNNGSGGIAQYLTSNADSTKDCIRWYDGDPTNASASAPAFALGKGWVNFMPPLCEFPFSIAELPLKQYYLVGARIIQPFKDFLLFIGPVVQSSSGSPIYLQDTVIFSQNGTPYYTSSFTNPTVVPQVDNPVSVDITFHPILVPDNQTAIAPAYFEDQTGFGGFIKAGVDGAITTCSANEDVLILGFDNNIQTRLIFTGQDIIPFNFYLINSEYGSTSTFSAINFDKYVLTRGERGFVKTSQTFCERFDIDIIDDVFQVSEENNGTERICAARDYENEFVYFSYASSDLRAKFPNKSLIYNYRQEIWGTALESYTTYGQFRQKTGYTWGNIGDIYATWEEWNDPWNSGETTIKKPVIIAGNQQGFVMVKDKGTGEQSSLYIQNISGSTVTSPDHGLNDGDFIVISGCLGTVSQYVNGKIFQVAFIDNNSFRLSPNIVGGTYLGLGVITRMYIPKIQSKQFPMSWQLGRKTRLGVQQYLLDNTDKGKITLLIFLSQNSASAYNDSAIIPDVNSINNALIYSTVLYTCPESTNLGLTEFQSNLQTPTAIQQDQIWHRINTSLIGDTIQVGFTLSKDQMFEFSETQATYIITNATVANPVVLTVDNNLSAGYMIKITGVVGMTQLNFDGTQNTIYQVKSATTTSVTLDLNGSAFSPYISGGTITQMEMPNQFSEITIHGFILDVNPSQMLV